MEGCREPHDHASKHRRSGTSKWAMLPSCLVEEILLQLPLDSFIKFRRVCRDWNRMLCSKSFLERYELVGPSAGPWILSFGGWGNRVQAYDCLCKAWRKINVHDMEAFSSSDWVLSDGGLVCYDNNIWNPLTYSTRCLEFPLPKNQLKLAALNVDRATNFYRLSFFASDHPLHSPGEYDYLQIYDSKEDSWSRTKDSPVPLHIQDTGVIINDCVCFTVRDDQSMELKMMCYDTSKDKWGSFIILPHGEAWRWPRKVHGWQNCIYVISYSCLASTVYVDELRIGSSECRTVATMFRNDFEHLLMDTFQDFYISGVNVSGNIIVLFIYGRASRACSELSHVVKYDLHTRKWSSAEERPTIRVSGYEAVAFQPRLNMTA